MLVININQSTCVISKHGTSIINTRSNINYILYFYKTTFGDYYPKY